MCINSYFFFTRQLRPMTFEITYFPSCPTGSLIGLAFHSTVEFLITFLDYYTFTACYFSRCYRFVFYFIKVVLTR